VPKRLIFGVVGVQEGEFDRLSIGSEVSVCAVDHVARRPHPTREREERDAAARLIDA